MLIRTRPLLLACLVAPPLAAQAPLALRDALARADAHAYVNRIAAARVAAATAQLDATGRGILPTVRAEAGWLRSSDPLAAFGALLHQRDITPTAFDSDRLDFPAARSDLSTAVVVEAPLVNLDAWNGRSAAGHAADATRASADWQREGIRLDVLRAYFGAVLAAEQVRTLRSADTAARAHVRQAQSAVTNGLATRSDALLAEVRQGEIATQLASAIGRSSLSRRRLALLLGSPDDTTFLLPVTTPLPDTTALTARANERNDLRAANAALAAARSVAQVATASLLPRINGFARYDWHSTRAFAGGSPMWTVGVMASWSLFSGGAELAARRGAAAGVRDARASVDAAEAGAQLELQSAEIDVSVAVQALEFARQGMSQAAEAHRIVSRKYDGGLAAVSELLDAQAAELGARRAEASARFDLIVARALLARARGGDLFLLADAIDAADGIRELR